jgi:4-carboxymuconolactone decarboxylase
VGAKGAPRPRRQGAGHVGVTDVIVLMGYYTCVSMTLAFYDVPAGAPGLQR